MKTPPRSYRYGLEFAVGADGPGPKVVLEPDWEPAVECVLFNAQREAGGDRLEGIVNWFIEPAADPGMGLPYCQGFRVHLEVAGRKAGDLFSADYFRHQARSLAEALVHQGRLAAGRNPSFKLLAWEEAAAAADSTTAERHVVPLPLDSDPHPSGGNAPGRSTGTPGPGDVPVEIPGRVLREAEAMTREVGAMECGGILIGHLAPAADGAGLKVVVTAQIPARQTESELTTLVFTPATWAEARQRIRDRRRQEAMLGWWHSHPARYWCSPKCPPEKQRVCPYMNAFFSAQDRSFHQSMYPKAYTVALVVTHAHESMTHALYGWRRGLLQERAFHIVHPE